MAVPKWLESVSNIAGAVAPITGAAAPILGAISSIFGAKQNAKNVEQANATNLQIARENNSAQERMLMMNNAFNRQQAIDMFNMENAYNSPENQVKLLQQAGLNPATMYQNGGQVARADASTPQAASSGITPTMPDIQPVPSTIGAMFGNFEALSRVASNLANAGLSGAQKNRIELLMDEELNSLLADNALKELQGQIDTLKLRFEREFGRIDRQTSLGLKVSEIWMNFQNAYKLACDGDLSVAEAAYKDSVTELNKLEYDIKDKSKQAIIDLASQTFENAKKEGRRIDSATHLNNASAANQSSQARLNNEQASQLEDIHDYVVKMKKNESYIMDREAKVKFFTYFSDIQRIMNEASKSGYDVRAAEENLRKAKAAADMAEKENSSYFLRLCLDALGDCVQGVATVYGLKFLGKGLGTRKNEPQLDKGSNTYQRYHPENGLYY